MCTVRAHSSDFRPDHGFGGFGASVWCGGIEGEDGNAKYLRGLKGSVGFDLGHIGEVNGRAVLTHSHAWGCMERAGCPIAGGNQQSTQG